MKDVEMREVLVKILKAMGSNRFIWRLEGTSNLRIYGVDCDVRDIDLVTNDEGIRIFEEVLKEWIVEKGYSEKVKGQHILCKIDGFEVDINAYGDRKLLMFDKTEKKIWKGLRLPVLPLSLLKKASGKTTG